MNKIKTVEVSNRKSIPVIAVLADKIWREYYPGIVPEAQIEYMLDKFQSEKAISKQLKERFQYYLIQNGKGKSIGYLGIVPSFRRNRGAKGKALVLSKIYLTAENRWSGKEFFAAAETSLHSSRGRSWKRKMLFKKRVFDNGHNLLFPNLPSE